MAWTDPIGMLVGFFKGGVPTLVEDTEPLPVLDEDVLAALVNRYGGGKTAVSFSVTLAATPFDLAPASGKAFRLFWVTALVDPAPGVFPAITVKIGATTVYKARGALSHWELFVGAADEHITVEISTNATVDGTLHVQEFTP